jgi:GT2 family glycosyltransferase
VLNNKPKIGLITVLYNSKEVLKDFFQSLANQTYKNYILYVIDNSPNDNTLNEAIKLSDKFNINSIFINNNDNFGVAKGNNQGIEQALQDECEYILLLNNDIVFNQNTIENLVDYTVKNDISIIVPKIYYHNTNKLWMAGGYISKFKGTSPHRGDLEEDNGQYENIEAVDYTPTCFMLINKKVFDKVGLMDEKYFVYYDDSDFIYRANIQGFKIIYFPKAIVYHKVSVSTGGSESLFSIYYVNRNRLYFIRKNFSFIYKNISLSYFFFTRFIKYFSFNKEQRKTLIKGILDSFKLYP